MGKEGIGDIYTQTITFTGTNAKRVVNRSLTLRKVCVRAEGDHCWVGRQGKQEFRLAKTTTYTPVYDLCLENIDLADLWIRPNSTSTVIYLIGTTKD